MEDLRADLNYHSTTSMDLPPERARGQEVLDPPPSKRPKLLWSEQELDELHRLYEVHPRMSTGEFAAMSDILTKALPGRTWNSISKKCRDLFGTSRQAR